MKRAAFFVEGLTELLFVKRLLSEVAGAKRIIFQEEAWHSKAFVTLTSAPLTPGDETHFALIIDCQGDRSVKSAMMDRRQRLQAAGYERLVGLRDVYPEDRSTIADLRRSLRYGVPTRGVRTTIYLAVMEIEAWFVQELSHFARIDSSLTDAVLQASGILMPQGLSAETLDHPAATLDEIYKLANKRYRKRRAQLSRTVDALDFAELYLRHRDGLPSFASFVGEIESFLAEGRSDKTS